MYYSINLFVCRKTTHLPSDSQNNSFLWYSLPFIPHTATVFSSNFSATWTVFDLNTILSPPPVPTSSALLMHTRKHGNVVCAPLILGTHPVPLQNKPSFALLRVWNDFRSEVYLIVRVVWKSWRPCEISFRLVIAFGLGGRFLFVFHFIAVPVLILS